MTSRDEPTQPLSSPAERGGDMPVPLPGEIVAARYRIDRVIGAGGMGVVLAARHLMLDQEVALKLLLPSAMRAPAASARFLREARAAAKLQSEHVVRVIDAGTTDDGAPFIAMELLEGADLARVLHDDGPLPTTRAIDYVLQACEAIAEAHALGIVHRDLKPSNLFLARMRDGREVVKLLDFGIAKAPDDSAWSQGSLTTTQGTLGSPAYMSPEQIRDSRAVDGRTDVWSLGVILQELLTGHGPFEGLSASALVASIAADPPRPARASTPALPEAIERAILACLEKDPARRTPTVGALAESIAPFASPGSSALLARIGSLSTGSAGTLPASDELLRGRALAKTGSTTTGAIASQRSTLAPTRSRAPLFVVSGLLLVALGVIAARYFPGGSAAITAASGSATTSIAVASVIAPASVAEPKTSPPVASISAHSAAASAPIGELRSAAITSASSAAPVVAIRPLAIVRPSPLASAPSAAASVAPSATPSIAPPIAPSASGARHDDPASTRK